MSSFYTPLKLLLAVTLLAACSDDHHDRLFSKIDVRKAGIDFVNDLTFTEEFNVYTFRNFYNGAGVGLGDFNNDGLTDMFFCGNQADNRLYLNVGNLSFKDATKTAGVASQNVWSTGVSVVDINGDGWLDIYICKSGDLQGSNRHNELFINQGVNKEIGGLRQVTFVEESEKYGLDDLGLSTHAIFFDYDLDGDLDCYLLNNSFRSIGNYDLRPDQRMIRDTLGGNKLFRNTSLGSLDDNHEKIFEDVSEQAGIYGSSIGFGLGVTFGDLNNDGWPDIYVSNDFFEKDYLYINQQDGTFKEMVDELAGELSMGSMGADLADINNDGLSDIFVTEMLPRDEQRQKTKSLFENWNKYQSGVNSGYHRQFARNVLQLNNGNGNFIEIGRYAGVEATDWSWGALIFDMDNDGWKDLFVANGIYKDLLDQDYLNFYTNPAEVRKILFDNDKGGLDKLVDMIPSEPLGNFAFQNQGNLKFEDRSEQWGFHDKTFSNGSGYGDLDNDGDMDLVINNINSPPLIYENNANQDTATHYLQLVLKDNSGLNYYAIGSKIYVYVKNKVQLVEINPARGFMSTVDGRAHFGLGNDTKVDSVVIVWPDLTTTRINEVKSNQLLEVFKESSTVEPLIKQKMVRPLLQKWDQFHPFFKHRENDYSDFDREPLLLQMNSNTGPAACMGDINNDGLSDFFIGGARGQAGQLFVQKKDGSYIELEVEAIEKNKESEEVACIFYDANGDNYQDLYVCSGSSEYGPNNALLMDRLYFNLGNNSFAVSEQVLPTFNFENSSSVVADDFDGDGDQDLIVGTRIRPYAYGLPSNLYLLENDGKGKYKDVSADKAPKFKQLGMVSDLALIDLDNDDDNDLVVVGEWMDIQFFSNRASHFTLVEDKGFGKLSGWWNKVIVADLDEDGYEDLILGNHGLNSRIRASEKFPVRLYINDFDQNGKMDQIISYSNATGEFPFAQRNDLLKQLPYLGKKYQDYKSYANQHIQDIFIEAQLSSSLKLEINELRSVIIWNKGKQGFTMEPLPTEAQLSQVYAICADDIDEDGYNDLLLGGNQSRVRPEIGINDGSFGLLLKGVDGHKFVTLSPATSGILEKGELREILKMKTNNGYQYLFVKNDDYPEIYELYEDKK